MRQFWTFLLHLGNDSRMRLVWEYGLGGYEGIRLDEPDGNSAQARHDIRPDERVTGLRRKEFKQNQETRMRNAAYLLES